MSLSDKLINGYLPFIEKACKGINLKYSLNKQILKKRTLSDYKSMDESDCSLILHKNEGRLLLTDKNRLYDFLIKRELRRKSNFI